jgi:hypothetical protein
MEEQHPSAGDRRFSQFRIAQRCFAACRVAVDVPITTGASQLIPKALTIDPYDRHFCGFWLGAIGAVVRVPQGNCNDIQNPQKSGLQ